MAKTSKEDAGIALTLKILAFISWFFVALLLVMIVQDFIKERPMDITRAISPSIWTAIGAAFWYFRGRALAGNAPTMPAVGGAIFAFVGLCMIGGGIYLAFEETAGFVMIGMGVIFTGAGYMVKKVFGDMPGIGSGPPSAPEGKRWALTDAHETATSSSKQYVLVDEDTSDREVRQVHVARQHEAFRSAREDWAEGRILSETERGGDMWFWVAVVFLSIAALVSLGILIFEGEIFFIVILTLIAAVPTTKAVLVHMHRKKFTTSCLMLDPMPPELFETVTMTVETGIRASERQSAECSLTFDCIHVYEERDSDGDTSTETDTLWSTKSSATAETQDGKDGLVLTAQFKIPGDQPPSTLTSGGNGKHWRLYVHADLPGLDYRARYVLPVMQTGYRQVRDGDVADDAASETERPWGT